MKNICMDKKQQRLVEDNLHVVKLAIHKNIIVNDKPVM